MVIDNRSNNEEDFERATAATVTGNVTEAEGQERDRLQRLYLSKHPYLEGFVTSPACALLRLEVETYYVVSRFQNVMELHMK
jgi:hypothetical protein